MVSDVFLEQLRNACPLEEIARTYVDLKRRGRTYVCNCPFHSEKTPSFTVFPDTQSFYCFGCGAGGDVITFIQQIENLDFMDAVKLLAQNSGMTVPEQGADEKQSRMRKRILAVNRAAANFYYRMLTGSDKRGLQYFIQRHLTTTTIKKYGLGFAPETWDALSRYLLQQGFTEEELLLADVSRRSRRGTLIDTFRNRVIFPIVDLRGNVIGFGGRVLDDSQPKYLNTAQTPVFDKGKNLFSLQFAKNSVTTTLILAEGYMDVIAVHQAGFENVVATLGTAITPDQARKISQYAKTVIIATGGAGRMHYQGFPTSNHYGATADGLVLAYRVGAPLREQYTLQYHPTGAAFPEQIFGALVTEKVRSLGAKLVNVKGEVFMNPLETRDVTAATVIRECRRGNQVNTPGGQGVWLDTPMIDLKNGEGTIEKRIPAMLRMFGKYGIDIRKQPILIYPTLHYQNGGVKVGTDSQTCVENLFVAGEAAGGVHGENRLMCNSLLDVIVFGRNAGKYAAAKAKDVVVGNLTLDHVAKFEKELEDAGITPDTVSPMLLPDYTRKVND